MVLMNNHERKCVTFLTALQDCYRDEENRELDLVGKLKFTQEEITDDFIAIIQAFHLMYVNITNDEIDLIGFTHIMNRLVFQYLIENNAKPKEESED